MDRTLAYELVRAVEAGAIEAAKWTGLGEKKKADGAAVEGMRKAFESINVSGTVVIGEGERDEAPMLFIGEKVGAGGPAIDIAVDPLEGTNLCARDDPNAIAVLAAAPAGSLLHAPDTYMDKICASSKVQGLDLDNSVEENLKAVCTSLNKKIEDMTVLVMDRDRHTELISEIRSLGARVKLIRDGDIMGGIEAMMDCSHVDLLLGIGAAPEGVITAVAAKCLGCHFQGRLKFEGQELLERAEGDADFLERAKKTQEEFLARAKAMGITDPDKKLERDELVKADGVFVATGVTSGMLRGVERTKHGLRTNSLVITKDTVEFIENTTKK
ncbi:MAG: class II fructose-bisphosphatase [Candidatus Woesearchaeota archaeon]|nr:class II fructose-bisphosphatase [Candidatus Woesearchaeota archaeon]